MIRFSPLYLTLYVVSYFLSDGANDRRVKLMMDNDNVDVWKVHSSGKVEMQMNKRLYASIENYVADVCHVTIQNVEAHVQNAEEQMLSDRQLYNVSVINVH